MQKENILNFGLTTPCLGILGRSFQKLSYSKPTLEFFEIAIFV